jgi:hypothetical protein
VVQFAVRARAFAHVSDGINLYVPLASTMLIFVRLLLAMKVARRLSARSIFQSPEMIASVVACVVSVVQSCRLGPHFVAWYLGMAYRLLQGATVVTRSPWV